ncbi:MAG: hypothetical protein ACI4XA_10780 [Oscillospiraceae bacterium]
MNNDNSEMGLKSRLRNKLSVFRENNPSAFVFLMIILANLAAVVASSALLLFLPENRDRNFFEMMRFAFTLMVNPSGRYQYSDYPISLIVTTVVVLIGMVSLTGGTVGYITSLISDILRRSAKSRHKLRLEDHIVILNYNHKVPSLLYDYIFDDIGSTYIVILAEKDKEEIEQSINNLYSSSGVKKKFKNIIIRTGSPLSGFDLDNVSLSKAKTVLLMTPEEDIAESADSFAVSKLFMFVKWYLSAGESGCKTNVIVETMDKQLENMVREYHTENKNHFSIPVNVNEVLGKIMAMIVINPLLNDVIMHMISFRGVEMYVGDAPQGLSAEDELARQRTVMPLFDFNGKRVYIAEDEGELGALAPEGFRLTKPLPEKSIAPAIRLGGDKSEIVIVGMNSKLPYILESLSCFKAEYPAVNLRVWLMDTAEQEQALSAYCRDPKYSAILSDKPLLVNNIYKPFEDIDREFIGRMNSVLFLSDENSGSRHIDEKPLLFWSQIGRVKPGDCIVEILDIQNKNICNREQVIVSDNFISCMFAQLGKEPMRFDVIKDILTFKNDSFSEDSRNVLSDRCNLFGIAVRDFYGALPEIPVFSSKRELIMWTYEATDRNYLPIGIIRGGVNYLFSRTDGRADGLDTCVLLPEDSDKDSAINEGVIRLLPDDQLVVLKFDRKSGR